MNRVVVAIETTLLLSAVAIHVWLAPFTKVEESFNMQATHDLLYKPWTNVATFDHVEFPGVVPRTFIGPIFLSTLARLPKTFLNLDPFSVLVLVRLILGATAVSSLMSIRMSLSRRVTNLTGTLFTLITLTQFHILFYASRTLPNTFALILTNFAFAHRLRPRPENCPYRSIAILSVTCALFRFEVCMYIFFTLLVDLTNGDLAFLKTCAVGILSVTVTTLTSIPIDSYFWTRPCYPELEVFYFNAILNKSSEWGTQPFHWYFTNALPRALGGSYLLGILGVLQQTDLAKDLIPGVLFVCLFSFLPHKELRFIFYVLPIFNSAAAVSIEKAFREFRAGFFSARVKKDNSNSKGFKKMTKVRLLKCMALTGLGAATICTSLLQAVIATAASHWNYPSGYAIREMHRLERRMYNSNDLCGKNSETATKVHIDADSAMNGITQFLEEHTDERKRCPKWSYSKKEDMDGHELEEFTHLISSKPFVKGFCVVHTEKRFSGLNWRNLSIELQTHTYVHRKTAISSKGCT